MIFRVIARLDVKPPNLVKGIHLEGFRKIGEPSEFSDRYYKQGADEISYQDIVASLYGRNSIRDLITDTANRCFVPVTVGGGIRSIGHASSLVRSGADKICLNTAAIQSPGLIEEIATVMGKQAVIVGIEAKRHGSSWLAMTDCGREHTGRDAIEWAVEAEKRGAGEILLTSIDREGSKLGFDCELIEAVRAVTEIPLIAHGGAGSPLDVVEAHRSGADAAAIATVLHNGQFTVSDIKRELANHGVEVR